MDESLNTSSCEDCEHCFKQNPLFGLLNEDELKILNKTRVEVSFKKGEIIYKQGMPLTHLIVFRAGFGKIYIDGPKEKSLILRFTKPYDINGGIGIFVDHIHHSSLEASTDCSTCLIDINSFHEVMSSNSDFMKAFLKDYSEKVLHSYHQVAILTQKNMEARMAEAILYLKENISDNGSIDNVSKLDLADFTAMSKESAIRVLKEFKDEKYIEIKDQIIVVLDEKALQKVGQYG